MTTKSGIRSQELGPQFSFIYSCILCELAHHKRVKFRAKLSFILTFLVLRVSMEWGKGNRSGRVSSFFKRCHVLPMKVGETCRRIHFQQWPSMWHHLISAVAGSCQSQLNKQGLHGILWKGKKKDQSFPQTPGEPCKTLALLQLEEDVTSICLSSAEYLWWFRAFMASLCCQGNEGNILVALLWMHTSLATAGDTWWSASLIAP